MTTTNAGRRDLPGGLRGFHVLVVEDAADVRHIVSVLLRLEGADVIEAANGRDALQLVHEHDFDLVVTDLGLPDIPGDVLIRSILAVVRRPVRVVVITGASELSVSGARQAGAEAVFAKPFEWSRLLAQLQTGGLEAA